MISNKFVPDWNRSYAGRVNSVEHLFDAFVRKECLQLYTRRHEIWSEKTRDYTLSYGEILKSVSHPGLIRYRDVTDERTNGRTDGRTDGRRGQIMTIASSHLALRAVAHLTFDTTKRNNWERQRKVSFITGACKSVQHIDNDVISTVVIQNNNNMQQYNAWTKINTRIREFFVTMLTTSWDRWAK